MPFSRCPVFPCSAGSSSLFSCSAARSRKASYLSFSPIPGFLFCRGVPRLSPAGSFPLRFALSSIGLSFSRFSLPLLPLFSSSSAAVSLNPPASFWVFFVSSRAFAIFPRLALQAVSYACFVYFFLPASASFLSPPSVFPLPFALIGRLPCAFPLFSLLSSPFSIFPFPLCRFSLFPMPSRFIFPIRFPCLPASRPARFPRRMRLFLSFLLLLSGFPVPARPVRPFSAAFVQ